MPEETELSRRTFIGAAATIVAGAALPRPASAGEAHHPAVAGTSDDFIIGELSIAALSEGMRSGKFTAHAITQQYLGRIAALDRQGPMLRHVIETNPDALAIADSLDAERRAGRIRGPLKGQGAAYLNF